MSSREVKFLTLQKDNISQYVFEYFKWHLNFHSFPLDFLDKGEKLSRKKQVLVLILQLKGDSHVLDFLFESINKYSELLFYLCRQLFDQCGC